MAEKRFSTWPMSSRTFWATPRQVLGIDRCDHRRKEGGRMQHCDGKPNARADSGDPAQMRSRLGMAGSCAGNKTPQGADATHSVLKPSSGAGALARTAFAPAGHGDVHIGHGTSGSKRHGT